MYFFTDANSVLPIFVGILVVLGGLGIAYLVLSALAHAHEKKLEHKRESLRTTLKETKENYVQLINKDPATFQTIDLDVFIELNKKFLEMCSQYAESAGFDRVAAIEDALRFSRDIFQAYSKCSVPADEVEQQTELVSSLARERLMLKAFQNHERRLLKGGLSQE